MINTGRLIRLPSGSGGGSKAKESGSSPSEKNEIKLNYLDFIDFLYISDSTRAVLINFPVFSTVWPACRALDFKCFHFSKERNMVNILLTSFSRSVLRP